MRKEIADTYVIKLYLSGPIEVAKQIIRAETLKVGLCVTIEPTTFIYTGGEETGYVVGLLNYPRFPQEKSYHDAIAEDLMKKLLEGTYQQSALMVTPEKSIWITTRYTDGK